MHEYSNEATAFEDYRLQTSAVELDGVGEVHIRTSLSGVPII